MLVAGLFGLDGVPGDALNFEGEGLGVEVGEGDALLGEDGEFAVGEEVDVAGVVEDAGDVGGEEELAVADADDGGRAHAGGDELVGLVRGEDADGEGSGDALDGAADGLFEGGSPALWSFGAGSGRLRRCWLRRLSGRRCAWPRRRG